MYGEEPHSRQIARRIIDERPVRTTRQLAHLVERACGGRRGRIHPATRTFQALRIAVNRELDNLESSLKQALDLLGYEGRLAVISYHSLEDRMVKRFMRREAADCICPPGAPGCICGHKASLKLINKRIITPSAAEIRVNPRSRSARLRAAARIVVSDGSFGSPEEPDFLLSANSVGWRRPYLLKKIKIAFSAA